MTISVRFTREWDCPEQDPLTGGVSPRRYPKGLVIGLDDDLAAVALALEVAEPMRELTDLQRGMVEAAAAALAGDLTEADLADESGAEAPENGGGETEPAPQAEGKETESSGDKPPEDLVYDPPRPEPEPAPKPKGRKGK